MSYGRPVHKLAVASLVAMLAAVGNVGGEDIAPIPTVQTWGDLLVHKPLTVQSDHLLLPGQALAKQTPSHPVQVWIGIDRTHVAQNDGVVLYCLSKGVEIRGNPDTEVGPFRVTIEANAVAYAQAQFALPQAPSTLEASTCVLAAMSLPMTVQGNVVIDLVSRLPTDVTTPPRVLARTTVHVTGERASIWSPWGQPKAEANATNRDNRTLSATVCNPVGGGAIPKTSGHAAYYEKQPSPGSALPELIPKQPDPKTRLSIADDELILSGENFAWWDPADHCLTRWWVNGKLWRPDPAHGEPEPMYNDSGLQRAVGPTAIRFHLEFHPERLGVKKGDNIGVQCLYCPGHFRRLGDPTMQDVADEPWHAPPPNFSSPSNRVSFIYSGDPAHPFAKR